MKILVVDDEKLLVKGIKFNLEHEGYEVDTAGDGEAAVEMAKSGAYDLLIMDVMMPKMDGLEACVKIREFSSVPIIMLTARSEDTDKLIGFEYGVDDYITKPFNILEVKARVRALLRRSTIHPVQETDNRLAIGSISLDPERRLVEKNGLPVELTAREFDILELLMRNPNKVYSRDKLLATLWSYDYQGDERTVDVHVRRIREKLEDTPAAPEYVLTKWGVGYYFKG
ncbi:MAG: response regulator transcription factor [Oscillospiraceae bacterium]|nr:response regulator transcription factor [Oscillospiraceae bacterium]